MNKNTKEPVGEEKDLPNRGLIPTTSIQMPMPVCICWCVIPSDTEEYINDVYFERTITHWMSKTEGAKPIEQAQLICGRPLQVEESTDSKRRLRVYLRKAKGTPRCKECTKVYQEFEKLYGADELERTII